MLVGVTGRAQHGKDTLGGFMVNNGFFRAAFADALKEMALVLDPVVNQFTEYEPMSECGYVAVPQRLSEEVEAGGWELAKKNPEVRRFLQVLGTEAVRDIIGEDSWVRALEKKVLDSGHVNVVVTDVRFPNEADWVRRMGGIIVGVERPDFDNGVPVDHPSEANVPALLAEANYVITNDCSLWELNERLTMALRMEAVTNGVR